MDRAHRFQAYAISVTATTIIRNRVTNAILPQANGTEKEFKRCRLSFRNNGIACSRRRITRGVAEVKSAYLLPDMTVAVSEKGTSIEGL